MRRTVPDDFMEVLAALGSQSAAKYYKTSLSTLTRWRGECGMAKHCRAKPSAPVRRKASGFAERPVNHHRDMSFVGQAADYLRRLGPINRCDADGRFNPKGLYWRRNGRIVAGEHVVKIAMNLGYRHEYPVDCRVKPAQFDSVVQMGVRCAEVFYGLSRRSVVKFASGMEFRMPRGAKKKAAPGDIEHVAGRMSLRAMSKHYRSSPNTVLRWLREAGISIADRSRLAA